MTSGLDIVTGLVTSAVYDGLRSTVRTGRLASNRRSVIMSAIQSGAKPDGPEGVIVAKALSELTKVLSNDLGVFTENVNDFLSEIQKTSILVDLYKTVVSGKSAPAIKAQFLTVYNTFSDLPFSSDAGFDALRIAIDVHIKSSTNDPLLAELIQLQISEVRDAISNLEGAIHSITDGTKHYDYKAIHNCRARLARAVEQDNKEISVETQRGLRRVPINQIVISSRIALDPPAPRPDETDDMGRTINTSELLRAFSNSIILGDPGGGKSTLVQKLCFDLAHVVSLDRSKLIKDNDDRSIKLPLKVIIRNFDSRRISDPSHQLIDYLIEYASAVLDGDRTLADYVIKYLLATGELLVLFDGLDEILNVSRRREVVKIIEQFTSIYPSCSYLITSRIVGYKDAPMSSSFSSYYLSRFNEEEITSFATKLIKVVQGLKVADAAKSAQNFMTQTASSAADLRRNPLMLGLMVHIFLERGDVPDSRPEIYKACANLLFMRWDQRRDINFRHPDDFELLDLFGFLALKIFGDPDAEDGVSETWLTRNIQSFFFDWYADKPRAVAAAKSLVDFITGRAWVMCDIGPGTYKFTHRTFLEYFVALRIVSECDGVSQLILHLYPRIVRAEWDVVTHLSLQIATSSGPQSLNAAKELLSRMLLKRSSENQMNFVLFVLRATEYLSLPENVYRDFVTASFDALSQFWAQPTSATLLAFETAISFSGKKREVVSVAIQDFVTRLIQSKDDIERKFALVLMGGWPMTFRTARVPFSRSRRNRKSPLWHELVPVRDKFRNQQWRRATQSSEEARRYFLVYGDRIPELVEKWKDDFYCGSAPEWERISGFPIIFEIFNQFLDDYIGLQQGVSANPDHLAVANGIVEPILVGERLALCTEKLSPEKREFIDESLVYSIDIMQHYFTSQRRTANKVANIQLYKSLILLAMLISEMFNLQSIRRPVRVSARSLRKQAVSSLSALHAASLIADEPDFKDLVGRWSSGDIQLVDIRSR